MLRRIALLLALGLTLLVPSLDARVTASLVTADRSIQPGRAFTVALKLTHEPHWHTYWINPGTGYPTSLKWQLPAGWGVSDIQWPTPSVLKDHTGTVTGNGYENIVLLPVLLTPPAALVPGTTVTLAARAEWLMCKETCIPGEADVSLVLPVQAEPPVSDKTIADAFAKISLPQKPADWTVSAVRSETGIDLTLNGDTALLVGPHFFSPDGLVQYDLPQPTTITSGKVQMTLPISPAFEGSPTRLTGVLAFGPPEMRSSLAIDTALSATGSPATPPPRARGLLPTLLLAFVGGLILNLMPCVFPVLGIKILGFVNQAGSDRKKVTLHGLVFTSGVLASFWLLAGLLAALRAGGDQLGWGFQLQSPAFVFALAAIMLAFGLNMSGVFEFGLRATSVGSGLQSKSGYLGSFFTGILATVVATPCSAPFLAPALGAALAVSTIASFAIFTAIAIGLSLPYLLLSAFPSAVKILPRPGAWMETFKQFMAFPLYGTVGYLIWVLAGQLTDTGLLNALLGLTVIALAVWLYGRCTQPGAKPGRVRLGFIGGAVLFGAGALFGWPHAAAPTDIAWEKWSPAAIADARARGKTIYVDFTARWCATCQANKRIVFGSEEVRRLFRERGIVTLKADWTNQDPEITAELAKYGRSAVPFNLVYKPGSAEPIALPELLTPGIVLEALR